MRARGWLGGQSAAGALAILTGLIALAAPPQRSFAATPDDFFFGTWTLQRERTHYAEGSPPESMTIVMEDTAQGLRYRSSTLYAGGRTGTSNYTASFDGTPTLVVGSSGFLAPVSLHRVNEATIDATYTAGLKKIAWSRWSVNVDGTELVVVTTYLDKDGENRQNIAVFRRTAG